MAVRPFQRLAGQRDITISRGTYLMHLEGIRAAPYREANAFVLGGDQ
jgi:hypothetical protein